jgi:NADH:ubiquinone oxidoreductase subunit 2 (subunit N)
MLLKLVNYHNLLNYRLVPIGIILVTIGMFFKIAASTFPFQAFDVYEGFHLINRLNEQYW